MLCLNLGCQDLGLGKAVPPKPKSLALAPAPQQQDHSAAFKKKDALPLLWLSEMCCMN